MVTPNGLELAILAAFEGDPNCDSIIDLALKGNLNLTLIDGVISVVNTLETKMDTIEDQGLLAGFINGGLVA